MTATEQLELVSANKVHGGWLKRYRHRSGSLDCDMVFAIYLPPQAEQGPVPMLWWLSGLTCTDENFMQKAGAQKKAAELGIALICPDTSPRGVNLDGEDDSYDFGSGAGFYVNATREPWARHYRMYDYVTEELPALVKRHFPVDGERESISGHSMGGHGALICALKNPGRYRSVSAFAPIVNPMACPWGEKAFSGYLGDDRAQWAQWDTCELVKQASKSGTERQELFVEQGESDQFLEEQLKPERLEAVCAELDHPLVLRRQPGYDHSYFFMASFIDEHLTYHAKHLF